MRTAFSLALVLTVATAVGHAQGDADAQLAAIRERIMSARFSDAIAGAHELLARTDLRAAERNAGLEALAIAQIANRQSRDAVATLQTLYSRDPGHRLSDPDASPPVLSAFARAREARPAPIEIRLEHQPPTLERREAPVVEVRIADGADAVAELRLIYRIGNEGETRVQMTQRTDGSYVARIPVVGDANSATDVAYQIIALAPSLAPLGQVGTTAEPLQLRIPAEARENTEGAAPRLVSGSGDSRPTPPSGGSVADQWWFWTLIVVAVLAVGGAVTAGILLGPAQEGPTAGTLGVAPLMLLEFP